MYATGIAQAANEQLLLLQTLTSTALAAVACAQLAFCELLQRNAAQRRRSAHAKHSMAQHVHAPWRGCCRPQQCTARGPMARRLLVLAAAVRRSSKCHLGVTAATRTMAQRWQLHAAADGTLTGADLVQVDELTHGAAAGIASNVESSGTVNPAIQRISSAVDMHQLVQALDADAGAWQQSVIGVATALSCVAALHNSPESGPDAPAAAHQQLSRALQLIAAALTPLAPVMDLKELAAALRSCARLSLPPSHVPKQPTLPLTASPSATASLIQVVKQAGPEQRCIHYLHTCMRWCTTIWMAVRG
jgi:hypothetical protein